MGQRAPWTEQEDAILRQHFGRVSPAEMRRLLGGRTAHAIYYRVQTLRAAGLMGHLRPRKKTADDERNRTKRASKQARAVEAKHGPAHLPGEPVITEHTRIVRVPAPPDKRFAVDEPPPIVNASHCREWARRLAP